VDVPDDDDGLVRPRVDADEVGLLVEPGGGGDDQPLDDRRREHGRELVRGEVARAPVQSGGQPRHPVPRQPAVLGPLDRKRPKRREWGRIRRGGGAVGLRHGMRRIRRVGFGFLSSFCSSFFISSLFFGCKLHRWPARPCWLLRQRRLPLLFPSSTRLFQFALGQGYKNWRAAKIGWWNIPPVLVKISKIRMNSRRNSRSFQTRLPASLTDKSAGFADLSETFGRFFTTKYHCFFIKFC
jgi:hypothetical protein